MTSDLPVPGPPAAPEPSAMPDPRPAIPPPTAIGDVRAAVRTALAVLVPATLCVALGGETALLAGLAALTGLVLFLNREARVAVLLLLLPVSSFQIADGWALYRLYNGAFVLAFVLRLLLVDGLRWERVPVLGWLPVMGLAFLPSFLHTPSFSTSFNALSQFVISGLTAWGVYATLRDSRMPRVGVRIARLFLYEGALVAAFGLTQSLRSGSLTKLASGRSFLGFFGDPNYYAVYQLIVLAIGIGFIFYERNGLAKLAAAATALLSAMSIVATVSRAGIGTMLLVLVGFVIYIGMTQKGSGKIIAVSGVTALVIGAGVLAFTPLGSRLVDLVVLTNRVSDALSGTDASVDQRSKIFVVTWRAVEAHPVIGVGFGAIEEVFDEYRDAMLSTGSGRSVHNTGYRILAETGIVGLLPSLAFSLALLAWLWRRQRALAGEPARYLVFGMFMAVFSYYATGMTLDQLLAYLFWPVCGLALALGAPPRTGTPGRSA